jgi:methyl-accepting chemotaxis protein
MNPRKRKQTSFKRRQLFISKGFQTRFILKFVLILVLSGAISIGLTLFNTQGTLTSSFVDSKLVIQNTSVAIMPSVVYTTLVTTFVVGLIVIMVTLLVSHKIAGPVYRFEKDITRIAEGDLKNRIRIRKGDQFQALASSLNQMIDALNTRVLSVRKGAKALAENEDLPPDVSQEIDGVVKKIDNSFKL